MESGVRPIKLIKILSEIASVLGDYAADPCFLTATTRSSDARRFTMAVTLDVASIDLRAFMCLLREKEQHPPQEGASYQPLFGEVEVLTGVEE
ncbi:hypothetical protein Q8A67_024501 [Cirrhinus molitorella]|uniref:Uncharacterized protein n=1 Tax=Cirrhinus molitorella TaxID=172907 RepID=A0AA88TDJ4_9TELE|nr:hypothetical protein Q8A67_024501 [Cirrhinus molitorella]